VPDTFHLERFITAQEPVISQVLKELEQGQKESHWMWFVFPQLKGLGYSSTAQFYAIASREEARAYLGHPILGPRLRQCVELVNQVKNKSVEEIFGYPDDLKFHSSMTLFADAASDRQVFQTALEKFFQGTPDKRTLELINKI
jgi:uncharacterized protein (DUF1810 family)